MSTPSGRPDPPAGWYSDPSGGPAQRYYDGQQWTYQVRRLPDPPTAPSRSSNDSAGKPIWQRWWFITAAAITALLALGLAIGGPEDEQADTAAVTEDDEPASEPEEEAEDGNDWSGTAGRKPVAQPSTSTTEPPTTTTTAPTTTALTELDPVTGSGDDVIDFTVPDNAAAVLEIDYSSGGHFAVKSFDSSGANLDLLVNTTDPYHGFVPVNFKVGEIVAGLEISASGPWTVTPLWLNEVPGVLGEYESSGDAVLLYLSGANRMTITFNGSGHFAVRAYSPDGIDLLVNETSAYEGTVRVDPETVVLEIVGGNSGSWTLSAE